MTISETSLDNPDHVYLQGLALKNYRGIGDEFVFMPHFGKFNIFIGPNNAGKSTVLNFISRHLPIQGLGRTHGQPGIKEFEPNRAGGQVEIAIALDVRKEAQHIINTNSASDENFEREMLAIVNALPSKILWYKTIFPINPSNFELLFDEAFYDDFLQRIDTDIWYSISYKLMQRNYPKDISFAKEFFRLVPSTSRLMLPDSISIPAIRKVQQGGFDPKIIDGTGLIEAVAKLKDPALPNMRDTQSPFGKSGMCVSSDEDAAHCDVDHGG